MALAPQRPAFGPFELLRRFPQVLAEEGFSLLAVQRAHLRCAGRLRAGASGGAPAVEAWSFCVDRLLVAQALQESWRLVSLDPALVALGVPLFW